ncbi:MAG: hypothetical protein P4L35_19745 [Ignavibacteriaceae bacterium]|nr:hypothetical protein [Ignavibacteriaceae bacterium]
MKYLVLLISLHIFIFSNYILQAQWVQTNGPYGGTVACSAVNGNNIFAGTEAVVYLSTNNGYSNWKLHICWYR